MPPTGYLYLLGPMHIVREGRTLSLKYNKARGLLSYLAQQPGFHTRAALADLFWPTDSAAGGRDKLKRMLFHIREALGDAAIDATRQVVKLHCPPHVRLDTQMFIALIEEGRQSLFKGKHAASVGTAIETLSRTVELYRGPFMQGLTLDDAPDFEIWLETQREDYARRYVYALRLLSEGCQQLGDMAGAIRHARQLVALSPLDETAAHNLIVMLVKAGQRSEAAIELERLRDALQRELNVVPGAAIEALLESRPPASREAAERVEPVVAQGISITEERRQITVVGCDLFIRAGHDPDLWVTALRKPLEDCEKILREAGGYTIRSPAGGLLGYFGYPMAIEGAARRAVEAALACGRVGNNAVRIGVGVHAGIVISAMQENVPDSSGQVSRLASSLGELAHSGEVLMSQDALDLAGRDLCGDARGMLRERHSERDIAYYAAQPGATRRVATSKCKPLIGREQELAWLDVAYDNAVATTAASGTPVCLLLGEAGIGKTRLVQHFRLARDTAGVELRCRPEASSTPFHPFVAWLRDAGSSPAKAARSHAALRQLLFQTGTHNENKPSEIDKRSGSSWKDAVITHLLAVLDARVPQGGMIHLDDAHWADPSTHDLLAVLCERPLPGRLLVVASRSPFQAAWRRESAVRCLDIAPLQPAATGALIKALAPANALPAHMQQHIVALSDGIPLFAEELALDCLRSNTLWREHLSTPAANDPAPMPASLHDFLMSRIDAAGAAKPVAQLAATAGAEFSANLLANAAGIAIAGIAPALATLTENRLITRLSRNRYQFRHALLRRAAYDSQPREARQAAHLAIARVLTDNDPELAAREPETLAWHYSRAGDLALAYRHLVAAGEKAARLAAHSESSVHYRAALALLEQQPDTPERALAQLQTQMALGVSAVALHGNGSTAVRHIFQQALQLAEPLGEDTRLFPVYWGLWLGSSSWADFGQSITLANTLVRIATACGDAAWQAHAYYALGNSLCCHGDFAGAAQALDTSISAFRVDDADRGLGEDAQVTALSFMSWVQWFLGRHDEALAASDAALARARHIEQPYSLLFALVFAGILRRWRHEVAAAEALATEAVNLANEFGMALWQAAGQTVKGWARATRGDQAGIEEITAGMSHLNDIMGGVETIFLAHLVEACAIMGETTIGMQTIERALHACRKRQDGHWTSEFLRAKGELLARTGEPEPESRRWLTQALDTARSLGSPMLILRAAASLVRHDHAIGRDTTEAVGELASALARVSGGSELRDIRAARDLIGIQTLRQTTRSL